MIIGTGFALCICVVVSLLCIVWLFNTTEEEDEYESISTSTKAAALTGGVGTSTSTSTSTSTTTTVMIRDIADIASVDMGRLDMFIRPRLGTTTINVLLFDSELTTGNTLTWGLTGPVSSISRIIPSAYHGTSYTLNTTTPLIAGDYTLSLSSTDATTGSPQTITFTIA